jgi:hypothetical protein
MNCFLVNLRLFEENSLRRSNLLSQQANVGDSSSKGMEEGNTSTRATPITSVFQLISSGDWSDTRAVMRLPQRVPKTR